MLRTDLAAIISTPNHEPMRRIRSFLRLSIDSATLATISTFDDFAWAQNPSPLHDFLKDLHAHLLLFLTVQLLLKHVLS